MSNLRNVLKRILEEGVTVDKYDHLDGDSLVVLKVIAHEELEKYKQTRQEMINYINTCESALEDSKNEFEQILEKHSYYTKGDDLETMLRKSAVIASELSKDEEGLFRVILTISIKLSSTRKELRDNQELIDKAKKLISDINSILYIWLIIDEGDKYER